MKTATLTRTAGFGRERRGLGRRFLMFLAALAATHMLGFTPDLDSLFEPASRAFLLMLPGLGRLRR